MTLMTVKGCKTLPGCYDRYMTEHALRSSKCGFEKLIAIAAAQRFGVETWMDGEEAVGFITDNEHGPRFATTNAESAFRGEVFLVGAK